MNEIEQLMYNTRRFLTSVAACVLGLLLIFAPAYAQTVAQKKTIQKQSTITQAEVTKTQLDSVTVTDNSRAAIRPFRINIPEAELVDLRRRVLATRWPDRETVTDQSQGVQLAKIQALVRYWGTDYDWRKAEAKLNALPQFVTTIEGLDIQFIHVRSRHANALPLIMTHGWPGSVILLNLPGMTESSRHKFSG